MTTSVIENIIVVMLENRSYDNMLGGLYLPTNAAPYDKAPSGQANLNGLNGLIGADGGWNPNPSSSSPLTLGPNNQTSDTQLGGSGTSYAPTCIPLVDPGEFFSDMAWQITGAQQTSNPYKSWSPAASPQPSPPPPSTLPSPLPQMAGFTGDYASQSGYSSTPPSENIPDVMNYFTPAQTPVTAWLANNFAVCDQWFASVPTQTFTNRAFAHCAAPAVHFDKDYSFIDDAQYFESLWDMPSIFYQLDDAFPSSANSTTPNWKVYFHDYSISMLVLPYVMAAALSESNVNVATFDNTDWGSATPSPITSLPFTQTDLNQVPTTFLDDLSNGTLPKYAFIEPRYSNGIQYKSGKRLTPVSNPPNSNHPGGSNYPASPDLFHEEPVNPVGADNPPIDVADGETFLQQIYNALYQSDYWTKTLLIITYDEHGGCYDHVPPAVFTPPKGQSSDTALGQTIATKTTASIDIPQASDLIDGVSDGFEYNVYGCRVPAIIVSPYIAAGTQIVAPSGSMPFDHASIVATVRECLIAPSDSSVGPLTNRDAVAPTLTSFLTTSADNNPGVCDAGD